MKYYTYDWCFGKYSEPELDKIHNEYISYIDTIFDKLPFTIKTVLRNISLHDGILSVIAYDSKNLTLLLKGVFGDLDSGYYHLDLEYQNCNSIDITEMSTIFSNQFLEILSDEFELLENGMFKHSILFSNGKELSIDFANLRLNIVNTSEAEYVKSLCVVIPNVIQKLGISGVRRIRGQYQGSDVTY